MPDPSSAGASMSLNSASDNRAHISYSTSPVEYHCQAACWPGSLNDILDFGNNFRRVALAQFVQRTGQGHSFFSVIAGRHCEFCRLVDSQPNRTIAPSYLARFVHFQFNSQWCSTYLN
jgi:hypothetical protein